MGELLRISGARLEIEFVFECVCICVQCRTDGFNISSGGDFRVVLGLELRVTR